MTSIGENAFSKCSSLTNVVIPNTVTSIGRGVFSGCNTLKSITVPFLGETTPNNFDGLQLGFFFNESFYDSNKNVPSSLKTIVITNATSIGQSAFASCSSITKIILPNTLKTIGRSAFHGCSSLTDIIIPNSVMSIGYEVFEGCSALSSIYYHDTQEAWENKVTVSNLNSLNRILFSRLTFTNHSYDTFAFISETEHLALCACGESQSVEHTYSTECYPYDNAHHQQSCPCGAAQYADHVYNNEWQDHDDTQHKQICIECGEVTYENHIFSDWESQGSIYLDHQKNCSLCGKIVYGMHTWNEGEITTEPTTKAEGVKTYTCTSCGATKTEKLSKKQSSFPSPWQNNSSETDEENSKHGCFGNLFGGCRSTLTGSASIMLVLSLAGACLIAKKKKD